MNRLLHTFLFIIFILSITGSSYSQPVSQLKATELAESIYHLLVTLPPGEDVTKMLKDRILLQQQLLEELFPLNKEQNVLWSLQPVMLPDVPEVKHNEWAQNEIDYFVLQQLEERSLSPAPQASKETLIRRVYFDITGLPPHPDAVEAFVTNNDPNAYQQLVDLLLDSPQYGERWGRHWLDVVRYSESQGFEYDNPRENAWHYRDYVINSLNQDKPYNQFVMQQIAGDVIDSVSYEGIIASSMLVCGAWDQAGSSQANVTQRTITREEELEDLISVVSQSFLGLTVNCARCHNHKFDPIPQVDYFRMKSVFEGIRHGERPLVVPGELNQYNQIIQKQNQQLQQILSSQDQNKEIQTVVEQIKKEELQSVPSLPYTYAGIRNQPEPTHRFIRGDVTLPAEVVTPGGLSAVSTLSADLGLPADAPEGLRRVKLAEWMTDPSNPLTPRVIVNRIWYYHFGRGIVATPNDFGINGERPSHPELLDWLAVKFMENHWSIKQLHRIILNSATYKQSSQFSEQAFAVDADNQWLWHYQPKRLDAESVRDAMLAVSGQINLKTGGPSFQPFEYTEIANIGHKNIYHADKIGDEFNRRSVYRMNVQSCKDPLLDVFDCPEPTVKAPIRSVTTTPLQALSLMNNSFVLRQANYLAKRLESFSSGIKDQIEQAYRIMYSRVPLDREIEHGTSYINQYGLENYCWVLLNSSEFLYVD